MTRRASVVMAPVAISLVIGTMAVARGQQPPEDGDAFRFSTTVELINVTATVTDSRGRFVTGLEKDDFLVTEDGEPQTVTHFSNQRVPVSLGIVLDTSGSMEGEKMAAARKALDRFLYDLLDPGDEIFLYRFSDQPILVQGWTSDRDRLSQAIRRIQPRGGTALYDAVAEAVPLAQTGRHRKKAIVIVSDGHDTNSGTDGRDLRRLIRETETVVYAIGIDQSGRSLFGGGGGIPPTFPGRVPFPLPRRGGRSPSAGDEGVNARALRELTDDSGGRTEVVRSAADLDPATAGIADELSKQYYLGYPAQSVKDGRWHAIEVEVRNARYRVRARRGYVATP